PAAQVGGDDPDLVGRQVEDLGYLGRVLDDLGGGAHRDHVVVDPADAGLRLEVGVLHVLGAVGAVHDDVSRGHRRVAVAPGDMPADQQVPLVVHQRGVRLQGGFHVVDPGQLR